MDITADTIKKVAAEASILSSIRHKNIVNIMGVSVLPPRYNSNLCFIFDFVLDSYKTHSSTITYSPFVTSVRY